MPELTPEVSPNINNWHRLFSQLTLLQIDALGYELDKLLDTIWQSNPDLVLKKYLSVYLFYELLLWNDLTCQYKRVCWCCGGATFTTDGSSWTCCEISAHIEGCSFNEYCKKIFSNQRTYDCPLTNYPDLRQQALDNYNEDE